MYRSLLSESLPRVQDHIAEAAARSGRNPDEVRLIAVTKGHPMAALRAVVDAGLQDIGENRLGELEAKRRELCDAPEIRWHMVGHVQSRKAPSLRGLADLLHSLDSVKLGERLERTASEASEPLPVLIQVNTSGEAAKYGFEPDGVLDALPGLLQLRSLEIEGLMTMAPLTNDRTVLRRTFRRLRELHERAQDEVAGYRGTELSMGMSNDYEVAVEEGSTLVRLGTVLLGERPT